MIHLRENGFGESISRFDTQHLQLAPGEVLSKMQVAHQAVRLIKDQRLFGCSPCGSP